MIIQNAVIEYLDWKELNRPSTKAYRPFLKPFSEFFKNKKLEKLTDMDISKFIQSISNRYSPKSIYYMVSIRK